MWKEIIFIGEKTRNFVLLEHFSKVVQSSKLNSEDLTPILVIIQLNQQHCIKYMRMGVFTDPILIKMNRRSCPYTENMGQRKSVFSHILDKVLF